MICGMTLGESIGLAAAFGVGWAIGKRIADVLWRLCLAIGTAILGDRDRTEAQR